MQAFVLTNLHEPVGSEDSLCRGFSRSRYVVRQRRGHLKQNILLVNHFSTCSENKKYILMWPDIRYLQEYWPEIHNNHYPVQPYF